MAKFGAVTGQTQSFAALSQKYGWKIRQLGKSGQLALPTRATPSREVLDRAIAILKKWDSRHFARTDEMRAYHLVARLQLETAGRSISVTSRVFKTSIRDGNQIDLIGKGGKVMTFTLSVDLHKTLSMYLSLNPGPLAIQSGYRSAFSRAMEAAEGKVLGTHGARRRGAQDFFSDRYRQAVGSGITPREASSKAAGDAIEHLGHSRGRRDHRSWYLGK